MTKIWQRFESKIAYCPTTGCWLWEGPGMGNGYGVFNVGFKHLSAHRFAYEMLKGPIPPGLTIDHLCRNRACVNPDHMEPVTNVENVMRGESLAAQNARKTHCMRGHEFTVENTNTNGGRRQCRACNRLKNAALYHASHAVRDRRNANARARWAKKKETIRDWNNP